jgi:hypothetical protein
MDMDVNVQYRRAKSKSDSRASRLEMKKGKEGFPWNGRIRRENATKHRNVQCKCKEKETRRKRQQTYLKISSQVLDNADQQLGLAIGENGFGSVRHG